MKKQYTKKQIVEAINYWKKQLRAGNYKRLNEELDLSQTNGLMGRYLLLTHNSDMLTTIFVFNDENLGKQACKNAMEWDVRLTNRNGNDEPMGNQTNKDPSLYSLDYEWSYITRSTNMGDREKQPFTEIIDLIDKGNYSCICEDNGFSSAVIGKSKSTGAIEIFNNFYQKYPNAFNNKIDIDKLTAIDIGLSDNRLASLITSKIKSGEIRFFNMDHSENYKNGSIYKLINLLSPEVF